MGSLKVCFYPQNNGDPQKGLSKRIIGPINFLRNLSWLTSEDLMGKRLNGDGMMGTAPKRRPPRRL